MSPSRWGAVLGGARRAGPCGSWSTGCWPPAHLRWRSGCCPTCATCRPRRRGTAAGPPRAAGRARRRASPGGGAWSTALGGCSVAGIERRLERAGVTAACATSGWSRWSGGWRPSGLRVPRGAAAARTRARRAAAGVRLRLRPRRAAPGEPADRPGLSAANAGCSRSSRRWPRCWRWRSRRARARSRPWTGSSDARGDLPASCGGCSPRCGPARRSPPRSTPSPPAAASPRSPGSPGGRGRGGARHPARGGAARAGR